MSSPLPQSAAKCLAATISSCAIACAGCAHTTNELRPEIGTIDVGNDITLRRMVARSPDPKGTLLLLHGFPETLYAWKEIATALSDELEVHAFDWPGYGQSSRPAVERFSYSPRDYAGVLKAYIAGAGIDTGRLVIYATDIGALPALLLALEDPAIARKIVVGDFAPFDRPQYMAANLQSLKSKPSSDATRSQMNKARDEILHNAYRRGLPPSEQFDLPRELADDMARAWLDQETTPADAFYHYYSHFTRDQNHLEANLDRLRTPLSVIWGEQDFYINLAMGEEFARRTGAALQVLPGVGHYPHLQNPARTTSEIRALFARR